MKLINAFGSGAISIVENNDGIEVEVSRYDGKDVLNNLAEVSSEKDINKCSE